MQMKHRIKYRKPIAAFMLIVIGVQTLLPVTALALTSGPSQPEASSFKQAGVSDMVDLFSGNFSYNLPVMDVDGYPLNLNYSSGSGVDDEASWVGLGWNLNVGAINRQLRGIPDDMSGDAYVTEHYTKPKVTVGGRLTAKVELKGKGVLKDLGVNGSFSLGVFSDNYTGIGAELGANAGISYSFAGSGAMTAGMGVGLMSSTQSGVDVTPSLSLSYKMQVADNTTVSPGLSASIGYNTRGGLKGLTLGASFSVSGQKQETEKDKVKNGSASYELGGSTISYNTDPVQPKIQVPYRSNFGSFSFDIGGAAWLIFGGGGGTGYKSVREVKSRILTNSAFGYLYAERGKKQTNAMMDFLREKENMVMPELPNLAVPVATPDIFSYTSQGGSGQFRLYRGGSGVFFDNEAIDESTTQTLGFDAGIGGYAHGGITYYEQSVKNATKKWTKDNSYLAKGDFQDAPTTNPNAENVFFKQVGEKNLEDNNMVSLLKGTQPVALDINGKTATGNFRINNTNGILPVSTIQKTDKQKKRIAISYLTAKEATVAGLDKKINSYPFLYPSETPKQCHGLGTPKAEDRTGAGEEGKQYRKQHHISEITVTDEGGKRSVYGIPVYNAGQTEYSFAIGNPSKYGSNVEQDNNLLKMTTGQIARDEGDESDHYLHKDEQPGYATSYLLSAILSPDYMDVTGDGISDDDRGTAIKFNYSKMQGLFNWRSPYGPTGFGNKATISKGLLADPDDDKASFVYGQKELWYMHSIETKTKIAYFITEDRQDAFGVANVWGEPDPNKKQKVLKEIRLYSKADLTRPIKIVKLEYKYNLCKNVPNNLGSSARKGKLTLDKVYFQYGNSPKGIAHPYVFHYNSDGDAAYGTDPAYGNLQTDRWGTYKPRDANSNNGFPLRNDEFPYVHQDDKNDANKVNKAAADIAAGYFQLSKIELPTGGEINVTYEGDDYAYVQNKQAMSMTHFDNLIKDINGTAASGLIDAFGLTLTVPEAKTSDDPPNDREWFKKRYLNGSDYLYTKFFVNEGGIDAKTQPLNETYYDFVPCYAKVTDVKVVGTNSSGTQVRVIFEKTTDGKVTMNPILLAAWQKLRMEYPRYAYPGYKNRVKAGDAAKAVKAAVTAIVNAAKNLDELRRSFYQRASAERFCNNFNLAKSFVRITEVDGIKLGGGCRVKKIAISDKWADMSGNASTISASYGQEYKYTMKLGTKDISSGVASYEPSVGNDENPMHQPVPYVQKIKGAINNFYNLEEPFGESLFPGASVGYSKVTVIDLDATGNPDPQQKTGYVVNEFYTAKEFPVIVKALANKMNQRGPSGWYSLLGSNTVHELTFSQGYSIELNDMHGKPKATRIFNQSNAEISTTEYFYNTETLNAGELKLKNVVKIVNEKGEVEENQIIGREIEMFTDMREQETTNNGQTIGIGVDVFPLPFFGVPGFLPHWPYKENNEYKLFRSACTMKVIQYYGIIDKVVKTDNGSSISTENVAYDGLTGEVVISKTQNEFDKPVYTVNFPAYWIYPAMGGSYKNVGTLIQNFGVNPDGTISNGTYNALLYPGDELVDISNGNMCWVIQSSPDGNPNLASTKKLVDRYGNIVNNFGRTVKVLRSGYRNMLTPPATGIVCMNDPISAVADLNTGKKYVQLSNDVDRTSLKVLTASATVFEEEWGAKPACASCPDGYTMSSDGLTCIAQPVENTQYCFKLCAGWLEGGYGTNGAKFYKPDGSFENIKSDYWGGACAPCSGGVAARMATTRYDSSAPASARVAVAASAAAAVPTETCIRNNQTANVACGTTCGKLSRVGVWPCTDSLPEGEWLAFERCISIPETKTYYIGYAGDNRIRIYIDGALWNEFPNYEIADAFTSWHVKPVTLSASCTHTLRVEFKNDLGPASVGVEIYNNTFEELIRSDIPQKAKIIFSTVSLLGATDVQVFRKVGTSNATARYTCPGGLPMDVCKSCQVPVNKVINPYINGFRGNWRPKESKVYQVNRKYNNDLFNSEPLGVDVRNAGYFELFRPFFNYNYGNAKWGSTTAKEWVTANTITLYDKYGQELENKDALGRYSAAGFVFRGDLPGAVASNSKFREIYYESFEDIRFRSGCVSSNTPDVCDPVFRVNPGGDMLPQITGTYTHSGNYSDSLPSAGILLTTIIHDKETKQTPYLVNNCKGEYSTRPGTGIYPIGFEPQPGKKYVFSAWVKDNQPTTNTPGITLKLNGAAVTLTMKAVVEKWKQVEGIIDLTNAASNMNISLLIQPAGGIVYFDDLRIHPFDAHMKTYAYDDKTMRLMAEMDENNFATFYEYDDEGSLVRVKKETERGIMTIKENRSSYKKKQ